MKTATLHFGTKCPDCARDLRFDLDDVGYCEFCTHFTTAPVDTFVALVGREFVDEAGILDELLAELRDVLEDKSAEDVAIWQGLRLVMVLHGNGRVSDFRRNR